MIELQQIDFYVKPTAEHKPTEYEPAVSQFRGWTDDTKPTALLQMSWSSFTKTTSIGSSGPAAVSSD